MKFKTFGLCFFLLQTGTSLGLLSGHIFRLAIAWWCLKETKSAAVFSSVIALSVAAEIYFKPFLSFFGDLFNRIKFIIFCQVAILSVVISLSVSSAVGHFNLIAITIGLIIISTVISVREPTIMGLIPDVVPEGKVTQAISSRTAVNSIMMLLGPVLATLIISIFSTNYAFYISALFLVLSCFAFILLSRNYCASSHRPTANKSWFYNTKEAFILIFHVRTELYIALVCAIINFVMFPFFSITAPYWINSELKLSAFFLGAFEFSFALGLIVGSLYINGLLNRLIGRLYNVFFGFVLLGSCVMAIVATSNIYFSILLASFCGMAFIFINVNLSALRSAATPRNYRTRMSAMAVFLSSIANPFGAAIAGWYINWLGVIPFTLGSGLVVILISPIILCSLHLRKALSLNEFEMNGYYEKTYPEAFYKGNENE
ncbi:MFS transporter [Candidatus Symbiopectobacterium sp. NZEC135]|uniref:MFS transporter n=1 Tax=Candidatus Symbiopectobacterium sp. NZEC135 TaxID=2820471 RepID=UPI002226078C|nr:MFS transporter [Candidatus Symbiopectobacterium sp. NZEC135]MCW2477898.1 MFS transporter [Candidatus Symbiopectobacterium sp. NZEC135]